MSDSVWPQRGQPTRLPIPGILQARTLEWVAISFSNAWKWKVKVKSLSLLRLFVTPWTAAYQAPPSMVFSRQEYWTGVPLPSLYGLVKLVPKNTREDIRKSILQLCYTSMRYEHKDNGQLSINTITKLKYTYELTQWKMVLKTVTTEGK